MEDTCLRFNKDTKADRFTLGTDLKDQVISKLSPSFVSSAVDVWSKYVLSDVSLMEIASLANKWKDAHIEADVLSGDSSLVVCLTWVFLFQCISGCGLA